MDKNSLIGFVLIAGILLGFSLYQSDRAKKNAAENQVSTEVVLESREVAAEPAAESADTLPAVQAAFKDSLLQAVHGREGEIVSLENDRIKVEFNTKGAQPYSALVKDFYNYDSTQLYIFKPNSSEYSISIYAGEYINTADFVFQLCERTSNSLTMRLPFAAGGYIQQKYTLEEDGYLIKNELSFMGLGNVIPRNVNSMDVDFSVLIPRMEKGYKNEVQYSKLDYYFDGEKKPVELAKGRSGSKRIDSKLSWFSFHQQFFSAIMRCPDEFSSGELSATFMSQDDPERNLMACEARMRKEFKPGEDVVIPFEFYFGPNHYQTLKSYDQKYEKTIPLGGWLVGWFTKYVIIPLFNFLHRFIDNFGIIILLMTIVIKIVVLPFTYKSYASSAKMQALKPEIEKINAKYPNTNNQQEQLKKQQATMELYKRADVSVMGGCLPTLLTFPILWAMFRFFPASIELRQQGFLWADDLSTYDSIVDFGTRIPLLGDHLSLFALLMAVVMWLYSKMTMSNQPSASDPSAKSMQIMSVWMMPIMMFFICNNLSAGLSYYYLLSQLIAMIEVWVIKKYCVDPSKVLAKVEASKGKPLPKSKWQQRLEEAQKLQQQQAKQNARR
ncbi:MAG: membrane protein insertase YidC [Bacteroidales bacterium]|nr:membrane protein insertase YidC [Bacteroidales bacterium]